MITASAFDAVPGNYRVPMLASFLFLFSKDNRFEMAALKAHVVDHYGPDLVAKAQAIADILDSNSSALGTSLKITVTAVIDETAKRPLLHEVMTLIADIIFEMMPAFDAMLQSPAKEQEPSLN